MPPPPLPDRDSEHLRGLSIAYYAFAGLQVLWLCALGMQYSMLQSMFSLQGPMMTMPGGPDASEAQFVQTALSVFGYIIIGSAILLLVHAVLGLTAARCLARCRQRGFTLFVAIISFLNVPIGTVLGVFTFIVLSRDSVRWKYQEARALNPAPPPSPP